jgi:hypothetical protein
MTLQIPLRISQLACFLFGFLLAGLLNHQAAAQPTPDRLECIERYTAKTLRYVTDLHEHSPWLQPPSPRFLEDSKRMTDILREEIERSKSADTTQPTQRLNKIPSIPPSTP